MSSKDRIVMPSSQLAKTKMEQRQKQCTKGWNLLKQKSEALSIKFRHLLKEIVVVKQDLSNMVNETSTSFAKVRFTVTSSVSINNMVLNNVGTQAHIKVEAHKENVAGLILPTFQLVKQGPCSYQLAGLSRGGQQIDELRKNYIKYFDLLAKLASMQTCFIILDDAIKLTNRRVSALEQIVIPRITCTIKYIIQEIEENERSESFSVKLCSKKKKIEQAAKEALKSQADLDKEDNSNNALHLDYNEDDELFDLL